VRWDDIEILKLIDACEESELGSLMTGLALLNRAAPTQGMDPNRDYQGFANELLLASAAGLLTFEDANGYLQPRPDPERDAHLWLQHIRDIRLTFAGHNWARGRVLVQTWPEPGEDDGRILSGLTLDEIAHEIGREYTPTQVSQFLRESGIPSEFLADHAPEMSNSDYILAVLSRLHGEGSAARRVLRIFIGRWLVGELHSGPTDAAAGRIRALLAKQGWHVRDGRLVVGELIRVDPATLDEATRRLLALHPEIRRAASPHLSQLEVAVYEAMRAVSDRVRTMAGVELEGPELMNAVFSAPKPRIRLTDVSTPVGQARQDGLSLLFMGLAAGLSKGNGRAWFTAFDETDALDRLGLASMLMRYLDEAVVRPTR
jgi:uncharacterized protein (TIGR02391 family)